MARDIDTYRSHIRIRSDSYQSQFIHAVKSFGDIEGLIVSGPSEDELYDALQGWINGSNKDPRTIRAYFSQIRQYLHYRGIKMHQLDIRQNLKFPVKYEEELHPLGPDELRRILDGSSRRRRVLYMAQSSSGMRIGEITQLRRRHLVTGMERIMVKIPASFTKKKRARTTFFSAEVSRMLLASGLAGMDDDCLVFGNSEDPYLAKRAEFSYIRCLLGRLGMGQRYESNGRYKISTHSFRAWFITRVSRHDPNLAKYFAGQKGYLMQYDRLTDQEKLECYLKFEPDLLAYGRPGNGVKARGLGDATAVLEAQAQRISELEARQKMLEVFLGKEICGPVKERSVPQIGQACQNPHRSARADQSAFC